MSGKVKKYGGFLITELVVALTLVGVLMLALGLSLDGLAKFNHYQLLRQHCIAAAEAQLESLTLTGSPVPTEDFERLWPRLSVSMEKSDGSGAWEGMKLVEVTVSGVSRRRQVQIRLARYILRDITLGPDEKNETLTKEGGRDA